jgi:tetratricopeptide (TPR) repeat protein
MDLVTEPSPQIIGRRYVLRECLGVGGMGAVYRATDRLSGQQVALKRVTMPVERLAFASRGHGTNPQLALAQEFKTLASLRHPNIIHVLDYGFDAQGQSFFTMDVLEDAETVVAAGQGQDRGTQVELLVQCLQALVYLHRRNVLHRDLKPENVLVADGQVRVLDFGLSVITSRTMEHLTQTTAGTVAYLAPELFQGAPVTKAADLYAVGVMAYEVFAGRHPFDTRNMAVLLNDVLNKPADVRSIDVGDELAALLERLLAKAMDKRYADAREVIRDLCTATGCSPPAETVEIRESFLQAARFVGRERELGQLSEALDAALTGRGSAWLVGGESGVGKSRLVDELRTLALVKGATVLRGQAIREGGSSYCLWRDVLRWLALATDLDVGEASVLKPFVPDIADLIGMNVPEAPPLDPQAIQTRLLWVVGRALEQMDRPTVVILEDLQWAGSESLALLDGLARRPGPGSRLFVGTYRDDERPHLPDDLAGMQVLKLKPLTEQGVTKLSVSMLGPAGRRRPIVDLLQRETGGNPFLLVEVVRALAEETGQLERIGVMPLPTSVFVGGVSPLVQRRLNRVPAEARRLLQLAAVAGQELDLDLLQALAPEADLGRWLASCADVAVLEVREGRWRFAHDRIREGAVVAIPENVRPGLHRQVAETLERSFPELVEKQMSLVAYHYAQAGDAEQAFVCWRRAGEQATTQYATDMAIDVYQQALEAAAQVPRDTSREQLLIHESLGEALALVARYDEALAHYASARRLVKAGTPLADRALCLAELCRHTADVHRKRSEFDVAFEWLARALSYLDEDAATIELARIYLAGAEVYRRQGKTSEAIDWCQRGLAIAGQIETREGRRMVARAYNSLGSFYSRRGDLVPAVRMCGQSARIYERVGDLVGQASAYNNLALAYFHQGDWLQAGNTHRKSLAIRQQIGDIYGQGFSTINLGNLYFYRGEWTEAESFYAQGLDLWRQVNSPWGEAVALLGLTQVYICLENWTQARTSLSRSRALFAEIGSEEFLPELERFWGEYYLRTGQLDEALVCTRRSIDLAVAQESPVEEGMSRRVLGQIHLARCEREPAERALRSSLRILSDLDEYQAAKVRLSLARLALEWDSISTNEAWEHLTQATQTFEKLGAQADLTEARDLANQLES